MYWVSIYDVLLGSSVEPLPQIGVELVPIYLSFNTPFVALLYKDFVSPNPNRRFWR